MKTATLPKGSVPWLLTESDVTKLRAEIDTKHTAAIEAGKSREADTWEEALELIHQHLTDSFVRRSAAKFQRIQKGMRKLAPH